ncbi:uncharacterized protein M421DRAFT_1809 [Didymella exigua CBS 183.55]|uniref:Uncharacterized protein n=1 Tax=Didymella exigua CBS 183.55 TaxID=1150837 RepID=A0A6A5RUK5_9PLEO|nr:uncharacterized protein M421DRAFT_1809 [Didymella exigua CBS 183.55]KAF1932145.1 hypothetical protein M421DRAFT_1809 [Didymella exigua CBS 183.55]
MSSWGVAKDTPVADLIGEHPCRQAAPSANRRTPPIALSLSRPTTASPSFSNHPAPPRLAIHQPESRVLRYNALVVTTRQTAPGTFVYLVGASTRRAARRRIGALKYPHASQTQGTHGSVTLPGFVSRTLPATWIDFIVAGITCALDNISLRSRWSPLKALSLEPPSEHALATPLPESYYDYHASQRHLARAAIV